MEFFDGAERVRDWSLNQVEKGIEDAWARGGRGGEGNPWSANMDGKMFWM
jgi:hypothetical protein